MADHFKHTNACRNPDCEGECLKKKQMRDKTKSVLSELESAEAAMQQAFDGDSNDAEHDAALELSSAVLSTIPLLKEWLDLGGES